MSHDPKEELTWTKVQVTREQLSQEDIVKILKRLEESEPSAQDKMATVSPFQQGQINGLLDELVTSEPDTNFEWSLAQIDQTEMTNNKGQKETTSMVVYMKRAPLKHPNPIGLFNAIERNKQERLEQLSRPPPRPEPPAGGAAGGAKFINTGYPRRKMDQGKGRRYHDN